MITAAKGVRNLIFRNYMLLVRVSGVIPRGYSEEKKGS